MENTALTESLKTPGSGNSTLRSLPDDVAVNEYLTSRIRDGFASSAYWGATGEVPPREPNDVAGKKPHRFQGEINRKLVPFPEEKTSLPRTLDYTLVGLHRLKGDGVDASKPQLNAAQMMALTLGGTAFSADATGGDGKPRFMEGTSTLQRTMGKGEFSPEVLDALKRGADDIEASTDARNRLKNTPFEGSEPDMYRPMSWDYCDMSGIDPSSYLVMQKDPNDPTGQSTLPVYKSRYNLVERDGPVRRAKTSTMIQRERNVDRDLLKQTLKDANTNALPQGYQPFSASEWMSTTHDCHAPYDVKGAAETNGRDARVPLSRTYHTLTPAHDQTVASISERHRRRHDGTWGTEYSDSFKDRFDQNKVNKNYSKRSIFDLRYGTYTMHHSAHHPRDDTDTGEMYSPSQIVPGQYATMSREPLHAKNLLQSKTDESVLNA